MGPRQRCDLGLEAEDRRGRSRFQAEEASAVPNSARTSAETPGAHGARRRQVDPGSVRVGPEQDGLRRRPPEDAWPPAASTKRSTPVAVAGHSDASRRPHPDRVGAEAEAATAVPACSLSSNSPVASAAMPESARLASAVGPHRRRTCGAAKFRHHHQDLAKAFFVATRRRAQQPLPDELAPDRRDHPPADGASFSRCRAPMLPRETRAGNPEASRRLSSPGSPVASMVRLCLTEFRLALLLERHGRLLVVGGRERHLLRAPSRPRASYSRAP